MELCYVTPVMLAHTQRYGFVPLACGCGGKDGGAGTVSGRSGVQAGGGHIPENPDLLEEVANLVEAPTVIRGTFSADFLRLPPDVLVMTMRKHQRYFPVYSTEGGDLTNAFVTVANGAVDVDVTRTGNEAVLQARFEDAAFFYDDDLKRPLADAVPQLDGTLFHRQLGSMLEKSRREVALVGPLAELLGLPAARAAAEQAAELAKADLATAVVTEMTSLAGVMGRHYAEKEGLPEVRRTRMHAEIDANGACLECRAHASSGHKVC